MRLRSKPIERHKTVKEPDHDKTNIKYCCQSYHNENAAQWEDGDKGQRADDAHNEVMKINHGAMY